jgi:hypothetical protein
LLQRNIRLIAIKQNLNIQQQGYELQGHRNPVLAIF